MTGPLPRVAHVIPVDGIGGVEVAAKSALGDGAQMIFALVPIAGSVLAIDSDQVLAGRFGSANDPRAHVDAVRRLLRFKPDVVIGSLWRSMPVLLLIKLLRPRTRIVFFLHSEIIQHPLDRLFSCVAIRSADVVWSDSDRTARSRLGTQGQARSRTISFVTERLAPATMSAPQAVFVIWARLHPQKGIARAIALIAALQRRGVPARYSIYGPDDGALERLQAVVEHCGLQSVVTFGGPIALAQRRTLASSATFFLQLSQVEGMGMSVVEAMQLGLVPVVTAVGEVGNYVRDGMNGLIVDPDALDVAAERIATLLRNPAEIVRLRDAAIGTWQVASLYREDIAAAAYALLCRAPS